MIRRLLILSVLSLLLLQCRKDIDNTTSDPNAKLSFSEQQILFDTVFTSVGSTTRWLRVYNPNSEAVNISKISIIGPNNAYFRMNVDGLSGSSVNNILLAGKDSLYIFIDVTIDPNQTETLPFIVEGSLEFVTNGNTQEVPLIAYGQQAFFITPNRFPENLPPYRLVVNGENMDTTWTNELPIVVYGYAVVDSTQHLTIEKGTQIHFHANSGLWVYRYGQITVNGSIDEPVVFQGDRLDDYQDIAGSWDRIWINEGEPSKPNTFNYAEIKNAFIGIQAQYNPFQGVKDGWSSNQLQLINTKIDNSKLVGIYANNYLIFGENLLVSNSGNSNLYVEGGGFYSFTHSTFANYWRGSVRNTPSVFLTNFYVDYQGNQLVSDSMNVFFNNSIIYGDNESEFNIEEENDPGERINFIMDHTLFKSTVDHEKYGTYIDTVMNPSNTNLFIDPYFNDFHLQSGSRAIGLGDGKFVQGQFLVKDLDEVVRSTDKPDAGVYEAQ